MDREPPRVPERSCSQWTPAVRGRQQAVSVNRIVVSEQSERLSEKILPVWAIPCGLCRRYRVGCPG